MSVYIPFIIFIVSVTTAGIIIFRKFSYLRKLTPEVLEENGTSGSFFRDLFPEAAESIKPHKLRVYKQNLRAFFESIISGARSMSARIERWMKSVGQGIRNRRREEAVRFAKEKEEAIKEARLMEEKRFKEAETLEGFKREEQRLILEVAKNPKKITNYLKLGSIYEKMNDVDEARQSYETVLKLDKENKTAISKLKILEITKPE